LSKNKNGAFNNIRWRLEMNKNFKRLISALIIMACVCILPPTPCYADNSSEGAAITVGLLVVVLGVLVIIGVASDVDYFTKAQTDDALVNNVHIDPQILPGMTALRATAEKDTPTIQLAGEGLRIQF
jgi:hypothetical protein